MFGITDPTVTSEEVKEALNKVLKGVIGNILEIPSEFFSAEEVKAKKTKKESNFVIACKAISEVCGDPAEEEAFRALFWKAYLLDHVIDREVLQVLAMGPQCEDDNFYIKRTGLKFLQKLAVAALTYE